MNNSHRAFTLTEVLIAVAIVGIIAGLVLPKVIDNYQTRAMDNSYQREVQTIEDSINGLAVSENKSDFFGTMMYVDTTPENYDYSSGVYMRKYLRTSKMCDNPEDCFADTYYQYEEGKKREEYNPDYKGSCAILKNGMSICMTPQIGAEGISGIIDLNGKKGPNVFGRDLRTFSIASKTRVGLNQDTEGVKVLKWHNIIGQNIDTETGGGSESDSEPEIETPEAPDSPEDTCDTDPNSLACCQTKTVSGPSDPCCTYEEIKNNNPNCINYVTINVIKQTTASGCLRSGYCSSLSYNVSYGIRVSNIANGLVGRASLMSVYDTIYYDNSKITYSYKGQKSSLYDYVFFYNSVSCAATHSSNLSRCKQNFSGSVDLNPRIKIIVDGYETDLKNGAQLKTPSSIYTIKIEEEKPITMDEDAINFFKSLGVDY